MLVHNEADRYLERVLKHASRYVDEAVILEGLVPSQFKLT